MDHYQERHEEEMISSRHDSALRQRPTTTNGGRDPHSSYEQNYKPLKNMHPFDDFDYDYIDSVACIAIYDTMTSTPQIIQIPGGPTHEFIEDIASITYRESQQRGGSVPYTVIREVTENFIHANFKEPVVSIFDQGNTIRFADQGPGIQDKERAQEPGFTSASEPMKKYIRGVGSGLPLVKEVLGFSHGTIKIEDNINTGSVVTISLIRDLEDKERLEAEDIPSLTNNDKKVIQCLLPHKELRVTDIHNETGLAPGSIHAACKKLETASLIERVDKKRRLTNKGIQVALSL